jgi:hypothetical protein
MFRNTTLAAFSFLCAFIAGCDGNVHNDITGDLTVDNGGALTLKDRNGEPVSFQSGSVLVDYQLRAWSWGSELFVLRAALNHSHGVLIEVPASAFSGPNDFTLRGSDSGQGYDISCAMHTDRLGSREYNDQMGCDGPGYCCKRRGSGRRRRTRCRDYDNCPGMKDVLMREDDFVDRFLIQFTSLGDEPSAVINAHQPPYARQTYVRDLSPCRVQ